MICCGYFGPHNYVSVRKRGTRCIAPRLRGAHFKGFKTLQRAALKTRALPQDNSQRYYTLLNKISQFHRALLLYSLKAVQSADCTVQCSIEAASDPRPWDLIPIAFKDPHNLTATC